MEIMNRITIIGNGIKNQYGTSSGNMSENLPSLLILFLKILLDLVGPTSVPLQLQPSSVMHVSLLAKVLGPMKLLLNCS